MTQLFSATTKKVKRPMTKRNKNIINFLKRNKRATLADVASKIQLPFSTTLIELKHLNKTGFVSIVEMNIKEGAKKLILKPIKRRKRKKRKKKQETKDDYIADLDKWMK